MYGFYLRHNPYAIETQNDTIGTNSEVITDGDALTVTSGLLDVAANSSRLKGFAKKTETMAADNATVAKVAPEYTPALPGMMFEADFNAAVTQATAVDFYTILTGTTGAQQLAQASLSATVGQFKVVKLDPRGEGSTTRVLCQPAFLSCLASAAS